jgi:hypothetical protein
MTSKSNFLTSTEMETLNAAVARIIPASGPGDWSAADLGVANYIDIILSAGFSAGAAAPPVFAGGPYRVPSKNGPGFNALQPLSRVKAIGWQKQIAQWKALYRSGLAGLDRVVGGNYARAPSVAQDLILEELDLSDDAFFAVLYNHTMEGAYSHPVYGGNAGYRAWQTVGFGGDVHGVRFPGSQYSRGAWDIYGGYAPEEMIAVGSPANERPVTSPARRLQ